MLPTWAVWVVAVLLMIVLVFHSIWEKLYVVRGAEPNRDVGIEIENMIRHELGIEEYRPQVYIRWAAHYWQIGVTALLALLVGAATVW